MNLLITIGKIEVEALFDTGSAYTLMKRSTYMSIPGLGKWSKQEMSMRGLSNQQCFTLGYKWVNIVINNENYELQCHVVDDNVLPMKMILGRDLLEQVHITIIGGIPTIRKLVPQEEENDIMTIEVMHEKGDVSELDCIKGIADPIMKKEIAELVRNYEPKIGIKSCIQMEILVEDNVPVYQNPRRLSAMERDVANTMVDS